MGYGNNMARIGYDNLQKVGRVVTVIGLGALAVLGGSIDSKVASAQELTPIAGKKANVCGNFLDTTLKRNIEQGYAIKGDLILGDYCLKISQSGVGERLGKAAERRNDYIEALKDPDVKRKQLDIFKDREDGFTSPTSEGKGETSTSGDYCLDRSGVKAAERITDYNTTDEDVGIERKQLGQFTDGDNDFPSPTSGGKRETSTSGDYCLDRSGVKAAERRKDSNKTDEDVATERKQLDIFKGGDNDFPSSDKR